MKINYSVTFLVEGLRPIKEVMGRKLIADQSGQAMRLTATGQRINTMPSAACLRLRKTHKLLLLISKREDLHTIGSDAGRRKATRKPPTLGRTAPRPMRTTGAQIAVETRREAPAAI